MKRGSDRRIDADGDEVVALADIAGVVKMHQEEDKIVVDEVAGASRQIKACYFC